MTRDPDERAPLGAVVALSTILGLVVLAAAGLLTLFVHAGDRAPQDAEVEGVSIGGLHRADAEEKLRQALHARATRPITVSYGDGRTASVDPATAGLEVDYPASVAAAGGGRTWSPQRLWEYASGGGNHRAVVRVDEQKLQTALDALAQGIAQPPVNGTVSFTGGTATGVPGRPGAVVDRAASRAMLLQRYLRQGSQKLPTRQQQPAVTPDEVNRVLGAFGRPAMSGPVTLSLAGRSVVAPPRLFGRALSMRVENGVLVPQVDPDVLLEALAPVMPTMGLEPRDARIVMTAGRPAVVPSRPGLQVDADALSSGFEAALTHRGAARRVAVPGTLRQPAVTTADLQALGVRDEVGATTVRFPYAAYRNTNLTRAAALVDGRLLRPGESFSLNGAVGARTQGNGFAEGYAVADDGTMAADSGSGITPLATALFSSAFRAGLAEATRTSPASYTAGGPVGLEATAAWPSTDLRFVNDSSDGVLVTARVEKATPGRPGSVTVRLWSRKRWDISVRTGPRTGMSVPAVRYVRTDSCQAVVGSPGFAVDVTRVFRQPGSSVIVRSQTLHTVYEPTRPIRCGRAAGSRG